MKKLLTPLFFILCITPYTLIAQISFAPQTVMIEPNERVGILNVKNITDEERELQIDVDFVYTRIEEDGTAKTISDDSTAARESSLLPVLKVFPKRLVIPAGAEQIVKFVVMPKPGMKKGVSWARVLVSSNPTVRPIITDTEDGSTSAKLELIIKQSTIVAFRNETIDTKLVIKGYSIKTDSNRVTIIGEYDREGNSPVWGTVVYEILDKEGKRLYTNKQFIAVAYHTYRHFVAEMELPKGEYSARIQIDYKTRDDIPASYKIDKEPDVQIIPFTL